MKMTIFSNQEITEKSGSVLDIFQFSLMSGLIEEKRFSYLFLHSVCCNITCHMASRKRHYTVMKEWESKKKTTS